MTVYVDTSAIYAVLDSNDEQHEAAKSRWFRLLETGEEMVCNSYVVLETYALVQHRLGIEAVRALAENVFPLFRVDWVDEPAHHEAVSAMLVAGRRELSLVDCSSFGTMRKMGIRRVFAFDEHFAEQGFEIV
ncbi:MAG TPA: PIN domain-containing protein [Firmicutes bacterium]|nr:PIN domain-containing protein [Candidatus Fermentithermobacillaceae bacterium]